MSLKETNSREIDPLVRRSPDANGDIEAGNFATLSGSSSLERTEDKRTTTTTGFSANKRLVVIFIVCCVIVVFQLTYSLRDKNFDVNTADINKKLQSHFQKYRGPARDGKVQNLGNNEGNTTKEDINENNKKDDIESTPDIGEAKGLLNEGEVESTKEQEKEKEETDKLNHDDIPVAPAADAATGDNANSKTNDNLNSNELNGTDNQGSSNTNNNSNDTLPPSPQQTADTNTNHDNGTTSKGAEILLQKVTHPPPQTSRQLYLPKSTPATAAILKWGHYKSHLLYSISQKVKNPINFSMGYAPDLPSRNYITNYAQKQYQSTYDFEYNDGVRFSKFKINDKTYDYQQQSIFVKISEDEWINQHKILPSTQQFRKNRSVIFSLAKEIYARELAALEGRSFSFVLKIEDSQIAVNAWAVQEEKEQNNTLMGSFVFVIRKNGVIVSGEQLRDILKFAEAGDERYESNWDIKNRLQGFLDGKQGVFANQNVPDGKPVSFLLVQFMLELTSEYTITVQFNQKKLAENQDKFVDYPMEEVINKLVSEYEQQISETIESTGVNRNHNCTVAAVSNLLGGMTYKYGELQYTQREEAARSKPKEIFSFTPSRTRFGWSFLWDDGFHNAVASKIQPRLSATVIKSWLDSMNEQGWICREQSRGEEALGLCNCPNFIRKDNRDGNPPSLILAIDYFLRREPTIISEFIEEGYLTKLSDWFHWYLRSQMVKDNDYRGKPDDFTNTKDNSFVFRYWDLDISKASMNSGLDDYPRNDNTHPFRQPVGHIDAQSWMYHFADILYRISVVAKDMKKQQYFQDIVSIIKERTELYFLDEKDLLYKDLISDSSSLKKAFFSPHMGYPNLLPLAFGLVKADTPEMTAILNVITNKNVLWTDYGLRSLSLSDTYYQNGNNYWTGPIWIQINYLVLRGLRFYYANSQAATEVYSKLRNNVSTNVCSVWAKTGYFYENYNKHENGDGSDAYPFTGWTATVALINTENY